MTATQIERETLLTSHEVGALLQMNPSSINKWIKDGLIQAFRTPGGHRRIRAADLVTFLNAHHMPVPRILGGVTKRLLVVDDDVNQLKSLQRLLKKYSNFVQAQFHDNGIDALVQVGAFKPHLILLDIFMPAVDGFEVCRRLKANPETREINVILSSGQLKPELVEKALEAGAVKALQKPVEFSVLLNELGIVTQSAVAFVS